MTHTRRAIAAAAASVLTRTMMRPREVRTKMLLNREFLLPQCAVLHLQKKITQFIISNNWSCGGGIEANYCHGSNDKRRKKKSSCWLAPAPRNRML